MRVLVAGGAGFIGVHLTKALLERGDQVLILDDFSTGWNPSEVHAFTGGHPTRLALVEVDVTKESPLGWADGLDLIVNLACPASVVHYQKDRVKTLMTCVMGTFNLLQLARLEGCRFLQASTSEIYGDPLVHPQTEDYCGNVNPIGPRACYDEGKRAAETLCFDFARDHGVDVRVARIFNTYGPMMHVQDGRLVSQFVCQALRGEPITVFGDGSQTRSPIFIADMVRGLLRLAEAGQPGGPVNLGNPVEYTVLEIAHEVLVATGSATRVEFRPLPPDDPRQRRPDISRARALLGWEPEVPFADGLKATVGYFRQVLRA